MEDLDQNAREIAKQQQRTSEYINRAKIPQSGYMAEINQMMKKGTTYKEIIAWAEAKNFTLTPSQISRHKKELPYLEELYKEPVLGAFTDVQIANQTVGENRHREIANMEKTEIAINILQQNIASKKVLTMNRFWDELIPKTQDAIINKLDSSMDMEDFATVITALEKLITTANSVAEGNSSKDSPAGGITIQNVVGTPGQIDMSTNEISQSGLAMLDQINSILDQEAKKNSVIEAEVID